MHSPAERNNLIFFFRNNPFIYFGVQVSREQVLQLRRITTKEFEIRA